VAETEIEIQARAGKRSQGGRAEEAKKAKKQLRNTVLAADEKCRR
jgi:hypothetical protein